jgi:ATP-binding cassette subfamily B protein
VSASIESALWPRERAEQALLELSAAAGLRPRAPQRAFEAHDAVGVALEERLASAAEELDLELEPIAASYARVDEVLAGGAPALLALEPGTERERVAALLAARGDRAVLLAPDGTRVHVDRNALRSRWCADAEGAVGPALDQVLDSAGVRAARRDRARAALLAEHLGENAVGSAWLVRLPPGRPLLEQARRARLGRKLAAVAAANVGASGLALVGWIVLGRGVLEGRFEPGWIAAWLLCLASTLPLRWIEGYLQADFALRLGALLRRRLLAGAARLDPQEVRGEGSGAQLGRVLESEALESLALGGGFLFLGAAIDLGLAVWAAAHAPQASAGLALLGVWTAMSLVLAARQFARSRAFAQARRALTDDLVERMVGHRTRIAQEPPDLWHVEEDRRLSEYLARARGLDRTTLVLTTCVAAGYALTALAALGWAYAAGATAPTALAIGVGAVLLGQQALTKLSAGLVQLAVCAAAWRQVAPMYAAAARSDEPGLPRARLRPAGSSGSTGAGAPLVLAARGVAFRHPGRASAALHELDVGVARGERVLVEGPSGSGKSTLASLLIGWRTPSAGTVLLRGLDRRSWGAAGWRARVAAAPQFHENRIFTASLAFNLLLGSKRDEGDVEEERRALEVCRDLDLGALLERMPSGLRQLVGETGWQLSHGEKSRVFIARALLSDADLVVLDESLAGLDPHTARTVLDALRRRAPALVVMAHP